MHFLQHFNACNEVSDEGVVNTLILPGYKTSKSHSCPTPYGKIWNTVKNTLNGTWQVTPYSSISEMQKVPSVKGPSEDKSTVSLGQLCKWKLKGYLHNCAKDFNHLCSCASWQHQSQKHKKRGWTSLFAARNEAKNCLFVCTIEQNPLK